MHFKKISDLIKKLFSEYGSLTFSLLLLVTLISLLIVPMYKKIYELENRISLEKNELETKYIRRQTIRRTLLALQHTKNEWPSLFHSFHPELGNEIPFLKVLEQTADTFNLTQNIRLEPTLASPFSVDLMTIPMQITLIGSFADIVSYMHALENKSYITQLKEAKMSRMKPDGTVQAELRYDTFWHNKN